MTEGQAISYAKRHYNFHPDEEFSSVRAVVLGALTRMSRRTFEDYTKDLCLNLMLFFDCRFDEVTIEP